MKKSVLSVAVLLALSLFAPSLSHAFAQSDSAGSPSAHDWPAPEQVVAKMATRLSLTDDQKAKITPIITERQEKMKEIAAKSERRRKKGREMKSVMEDSNKQINALLTDEQKQKYSEMQQEVREQMKQRREQGGSSPH